MAQQPNAILAISSTDRYIANLPGKVNQPFSNTAEAQWLGGLPLSNDFSISAPSALINGYIEKIIVSQIQLEYYVPTIIPGRNDTLLINIESPVGSSTFIPIKITIPYGFYKPSELANLLQALITLYADAIIPDFDGFIVSYNQGSTPYQSNTNVLNLSVGFVFEPSDSARRIYFPLPSTEVPGLSPNEFTTVYRTYRLLGLTQQNANPSNQQFSSAAPTFLYTPYIDIYSDNLTNYQRLKDTDSSTSKRKGLIARLYLSGVGQPQATSEISNLAELAFNFNGEDGTGTLSSVSTDALGSSPFIMTYDLNSPKVINWTPDVAVNSLDFQMRDCYGDLLFCQGNPVGAYNGEVFNTEFQMTLLCVEKDY